MAENGPSSQQYAVPTPAHEENGSVTPPPVAHMPRAPPPPLPSSTIAPRLKAKTGLEQSCRGNGSESQVGVAPSGRRVHFDTQVRHSSDGSTRPNSLNIVSSFRTPPIEVTPPVGDNGSGSAGSYFDIHHSTDDDECQRQEGDDKSTPLPTPIRKGSRRARQKTFEEEVRAALESKPVQLNLDGRPRREKFDLMTMLGSYSAPVSSQTSPIASPVGSPEALPRSGAAPGRNSINMEIPPLDLEKGQIMDNSLDEEKECRPQPTATTEAHKLVRAHTQRLSQAPARRKSIKDLDSGATTPIEGKTGPSHEQIRSGVLSSLLKLYNHQHGSTHSSSSTVAGSPSASGRSTPKWYSKSANNSATSLVSGLMGSNQTLMAPGAPAGSRVGSPTGTRTLKHTHKMRPGTGLSGMFKQMYAPKPNLADEIRITIHIAELLSRQKYVLKLCRALMLYGAPTHRLEEYMRMTCRVLEIDGQFLYIPGCMVISFDDHSTHTSDMRIVRVTQGCDLGKLHDTHLVYKNVVHDIIGVDEAIKTLDEIISRPRKHPAWAIVIVHGLASALVGPFAFQARPIDMPISFILGCILGILQIIVAPRSDMYTNVFEISASIIMSFLARAFGSINNGQLFCFSALTQSSIALILPGYIILCGSLELQSKNIVAGSVRMFYAIIYSLFLGFGITVGAALYGALDKNATSATTCQNPLPRPWSFLFVPLFALCLLIVNQAKWRQAPVMVAIATAGYAVNYFSMERFATNPQVVSGLGALAIGVMGNLYSRIGHGLAFAAMLPAIFVQVPSGLAAQGSIIAGIKNADAIARNQTGDSQDSINSTVLNLGFSMIQISIGLTVGLFATALLLYPFGKKRSGLFTF